MNLLQSNLLSDSLSYIDIIKAYAISYIPKIAGAILFYIIGSWIINRLVLLLKKILFKRNYDPSLQTFLVSLVKVVLTILLLISIAGILGADTTAFSALIVGAGVAIGSALNGTLGNFAGGVMLLVFKPFKVGDMIEAQGITGVVTEQGVFNTTVLTAENKTVYLPNGALSTNTIANYTTHGSLRVDITMAIAPDMDIEKAKKVAIQTILTHPKVLQTPAPEVNALKVGDGMVTLAIRPYCVQTDYWDVFFGCTEMIKKAFEHEGIHAPTPHRIIINK
ncbi:MAG: mechanosensitive ion channel family protein [Bacteroidetes bacterium]|nr:mechanosensitive ion channel family protein [Bacteroidota bacterium]